MSKLMDDMCRKIHCLEKCPHKPATIVCFTEHACPRALHLLAGMNLAAEVYETGSDIGQLSERGNNGS